MLQQTRLDKYYKVKSSSQKPKEVKQHEINTKSIVPKRRSHVKLSRSKKIRKMLNDQNAPSDNLLKDVEVIRMGRIESEEVQIIDVKMTESNEMLERVKSVSFSQQDTSPLHLPPSNLQTSKFSNHNESSKMIPKTEICMSPQLNSVLMANHSMLPDSEKPKFSNNESPKKISKTHINMSPRSSNTSLIADHSQFTNPKQTSSSKKNDIRSTVKTEPMSPQSSFTENSISPKSAASPRKSYTPKKSSPLKRSSSASRVNRKLFFEVIDWELTIQAIDNLNLVKQGAIRENNFNLEQIYETNSFRFSYGAINPKASTKYEKSDIVMPKEANAAYLFMMIVTVFSNPVNCGYFDEQELDLIFSILKLSEKAQMLLVRMLKRKLSWYRVSLLKYPEIAENLQPVFEELVLQSICSSDIENEDMSIILKLLQVDEIRKICQDLKIPGTKKKDINISQLLKLSNTSKPLFPGMKSPTSAVNKLSINKLGYCVRITTKMLDIFDRIVALLIPNWDPEKSTSDIFLMFYDIQKGLTIFPTELSGEKFPIFSDKNHLICYVEARKVLSEILSAISKKYWDTVREKGQLAFQRVSMLLKIESESNKNSTLPDYIKRYMPAYTWLKIMSMSIDAFKKSPDTLPQAELFLRTLLTQQYHMHWMKGKWYAELILIKTYHKKEMEAAADIIIEALYQKENFTDIDKIEIAKKADKLIKRKTGGISDHTKIKIHEVLDDILNHSMFTFKPACNTIHANLIRGNSASNQKSVWILEDSSESRIYASVENLALNYYCHQNYRNGIHCEGALPVTLFAILFWEELYCIRIPGIWLSEYQYFPEDLCSLSFYRNRKTQIDSKLDMLRQLSVKELSDMIETAFNLRCKYTSLIHSSIFKSSNDLKEIVECLGTDAVIRICERLIADYKSWKSGFPDLMVWNSETKKYKIVEVKGPGDSLSTKQELWLGYLHELGLDAEVCIVKALGNVKARMA